MPKKDFYDHLFEDYFLLYQPKDVLSGDFHYLKVTTQNIIFAVGDCTGHGVPGAMLSVLGINMLNETIRRKEVMTPADALEQMKYLINSTFEESNKSDGMDLALCALDNEKGILKYAGAHMPMYIVRNGELIKHFATRSPIGKHLLDVPFEDNEVKLKKNDRIYIFSDGFPDQFGGDEKPTKKFSRKRLLDELVLNHSLPMEEQKQKLLASLSSWQGKEEQTDDITVFAFQYK